MAMSIQEATSIGGKIMAVRQREAAIASYYANPKICPQCLKVIEIPEGVKVSVIRQRKFCSGSCAAIYNNLSVDRRRGPLPSNEVPTKLCKNCGESFSLSKIKNGSFSYNKLFCEKCARLAANSFNSLTKEELFNKRLNYQSARSSIRDNAQKTFQKLAPSQTCKVCGYDKHVEVCHILPVSSFPPTALISEINAIENLVGLCPNHHWEFDEGLLKIDA